MDYRHAFHAGNFADLLKHAVLTEILARLTAETSPLTVIDTHAGAGLYDLTGDMARRTGEAERGIGVLMAEEAAPAAFARLKAAVRRINGGGPVRLYPGSPVLIAQALRPGDRLVACEVRPDDHAALRDSLAGRANVTVLKADGWAAAEQRTPRPPARVLVLIDPPFEGGDDPARIAATVRALRRANAAAVIAIWTPIKELAAYDALLADIEDAVGEASLLVAEVRLRPPTDPMRMNGCAMAVVSPPHGLAATIELAATWIAARLGEAGGVARVAGGS